MRDNLRWQPSGLFSSTHRHWLDDEMETVMLVPSFPAMPHYEHEHARHVTLNTQRACELDSKSLDGRLAKGAVKRLAAKEHLFLEGDAKSHVYMVEAGTVLIYKILADSKRQVVDIAFAGDYIGLGLPGEHAFNAQATEATRVRCQTIGSIHQLAAHDPRLALALYEAVALELDAARNHLLTLGYRDASGRVASFLLALARRNERHGRGAREFVLPMRRADIGDFLGLTIETVSRTFSKLKAEGLIDLDQGGYIEICNAEALEQIARGEGGHA